MKLIPFAVIAATAGLAHAESLTIDVSDIQFWDEQGDGINTTLSIPLCFASITITNIAWDVNLTTFTDPNATFPSWASEAAMLFEDEIVINVSNDSFGVVNQNYAGDVNTNLVTSPDGILDIEFFESFDDGAGNPDAIFENGSSLTFSFICFPTPNTLSMLGFGSLIATRRKR